jgi:RNA polymerase subunit RPABC4/transcription elongation factor Spt4
LPKYQQTVFKARFTNVLNVAESLKKAHELYYLVNGAYIADMTKLDWDFQKNCNLYTNDVIACDKYFMIDQLYGYGVITDPEVSLIDIRYCPGHSKWEHCFQENGGNPEFYYRVWLDHSSHPGLRECKGITDEGNKLCKMLGF